MKKILLLFLLIASSIVAYSQSRVIDSNMKTGIIAVATGLEFTCAPLHPELQGKSQYSVTVQQEVLNVPVTITSQEYTAANYHQIEECLPNGVTLCNTFVQCYSGQIAGEPIKFVIPWSSLILDGEAHRFEATVMWFAPLTQVPWTWKSLTSPQVSFVVPNGNPAALFSSPSTPPPTSAPAPPGKGKKNSGK